MSEISLAIGDGARRMTYAELAQARGISLAAARRLTLRHRWHKQLGNDGFVVVSVPLSTLGKPRKTAPNDDATSRRSVIPDDAVSDPVRDAGSDSTRLEHMLAAIRETVEALMTPIREQLDRERARADRAEQQLTAVEAELVEARVEAAGLRCRLEQARPKPAPDSPRSPWRRFLAWRR